jgi:hypothetical protein
LLLLEQGFAIRALNNCMCSHKKRLPLADWFIA